MFIQRQEQLQLLNKSFSSAQSSFDIIYGAKNTGKTALINHFIKDKNCIYFSSFEMMPNLFFTNMANTISNHFHNCNTVGKPFNNLEEVLEFFLEQEVQEKLVFVIDDFQTLLKCDKKALNTLTFFWKKKLKLKNIQLIVSTSLLLNENSLSTEFHKQANNIIQLQYLKFTAIKEFLPKLNKLDQLYVYSLLGTSPSNLKYYNPKVDFTDNIINLFISSNSYLFEYGIKVLKEEITEIGTYCSILYAISNANNKIGEIAKALDTKSTYLTRYLQKLIDMQIIKKTIPIGEEKNKNSKYGRYEIQDNTLIFWFLYIYPNIRLLQQNNAEEVIKTIQEEYIKKTVFQSYKKCIKELIYEKQESIFGYKPDFIGPWWDNKDNTIDLIAYNKKTITFVQILWEDKNIAKIAYAKLKSASENFQTSLRKKYIIVTKDTFLSSQN